MKQFEQCRFIRMVSQTMLFIARRFLILAALCLAENKNQRTVNPIQLILAGLLQPGVLSVHA
jgi:hypothetical protein